MIDLLKIISSLNIVNELFFIIIFGIILFQLSRGIKLIEYSTAILIPTIFTIKNLNHLLDSNFDSHHFVLMKFFHTFEIKFHYSFISCIFLTLVGILWLMNSIYSIGYLKIKSIDFSNFSSLVFGSIAVLVLLVTSGNLITLFTAYEILTLITYFLVSFDRTFEAYAIGKKYFSLLFVSSTCFFLLAIAIVYVFSGGNLNFMDGGILSLYPKFTEIWYLPLVVLLLFLYGCSKSATAPLHFWLPEAMIAHIPVSALLHAVAVVKSGIMALLYVVIYIFGIEFLSTLQNQHQLAFQIPKYIAGISAIYSYAIATRKLEFKKILAYSTIGQLGYMVMIIFSFHQGMEKILLLQLIAHAVAKINMFFIAGFLYLKYKIKKVNELNGIWRFEPIVAISFAISVFSIIGIPLTIGTMSKFNIILYGIRNHEYFLLGVVLLGTIISCYYLLPILVDMFFGRYTESEGDIKAVDIDRSMKKYYNILYIPIALVAVLVIALFFVPYSFLI